MRHAVFFILFFFIICSNVYSEILYISESNVKKPEMVKSVELFEKAGYAISTDRKSSDVCLNMAYSTHSEETPKILRGGYKKRFCSATATLTEQKTGKLVSSGNYVVSYTTDVSLPVNIPGGSGRNVKIGKTNAQDLAKEQATIKAIEDLLIKQGRLQKEQQEQEETSSDKEAERQEMFRRAAELKGKQKKQADAETENKTLRLEVDGLRLEIERLNLEIENLRLEIEGLRLEMEKKKELKNQPNK